jgi:hypothetical protein
MVYKLPTPTEYFENNFPNPVEQILEELEQNPEDIELLSDLLDEIIHFYIYVKDYYGL